MLIDELRRHNLSILADESGGVGKLAEILGKDSSQVSQWINGSKNSSTGKPRGMRSNTCREIEEKTRKPLGWLDADHRSRAAGMEANTSPGPAMYTPVPLISWVQAGDWCGVVDNFAPGDADEWLPVPRAHGPNSYALRVRGVSMEPRYRDGSIIFVDPSKQADHGSNVVVRMDNESEATFKQLVIEGDTKFLRALNPDWPGPKLIEINSNATICGVVIGQFIPD